MNEANQEVTWESLTSTVSNQLRPAHNVSVFSDPICRHVWNEKYRWNNEEGVAVTFERVARAILGGRENDLVAAQAYQLMKSALFIPGGRILAGAGTTKVVTLINCYVCQTIDDSMDGIADAFKEAMLTMQQGGGIGMDFSTLRPSGADLRRTGAVASGPLPFMRMWDSMCETIMSAGSRRGAMMATMRCDHPDVMKFVTAKQKAGELTNFNISVLVTDDFMDAVEHDEMWQLGFNVPPHDRSHLFSVLNDEGDAWYVYQEISARELWEAIIRNTYEYSEPGIIFIDRINQTNNLQYCETISCTNPCGEQPLPPEGACNLGAVNLSRMVGNPFTEEAYFDFDLLATTTEVATKFLDAVLDATNYPVPAQYEESRLKRRVGLGFMGLADACLMLGIRYGNNEQCLRLTNEICQTLASKAYATSIDLAEVYGHFPLWERAHFGGPVFQKATQGVLGSEMRAKYLKTGIRNGVLLTIAPTGTTALFAGNTSSGMEPSFGAEHRRNVRMPDGSTKPFDVRNYAIKVWQEMGNPKGTLPPNYVDFSHLTIADHTAVQAVCQRWIDASISKTINCPEDMNFEAFEQVYMESWRLNLKGCTTYRPSEVRGAVLEQLTPSKERPDVLKGETHKIRWPHSSAAYYLTVNSDLQGKPREIFVHSKATQLMEWTTALSLLISALLKEGRDVSFIARELQTIQSVHEHSHIKGKFYGSLVAYLGHILEGYLGGTSKEAAPTPEPTGGMSLPGEVCTNCGQPTMIHQEGCATCTSCGFSKCG